MTDKMCVTWWDDASDREIEDWNFPSLDVRPMVGDCVHYWQDGREEAAGTGPLDRRDYIVTRVEHDLRFMPGRGGSPKYVHSLNVYIRQAQP
jgi:hypothetical protein